MPDVCKAYQQLTKVLTSGLRVKAFMKCVKDHINANIVPHLLITSKSADSFYWIYACIKIIKILEQGQNDISG